MPRQRLPKSDSGTATSRMSSVIAIAKTPSLNASIRPVPQRSPTTDHFHSITADPAQPPTRTDMGHPPERAWASADLLGQPDENVLGASDVAEPIHVFVLDHFVDELRAVLTEPAQRLVEVVHREHDAEVAEGVYRRIPVIGDRRRREKARELNPTVAVRHTQHRSFDALVAQSSDAP